MPILSYIIVIVKFYPNIFTNLYFILSNFKIIKNLLAFYFINIRIIDERGSIQYDQ